MQKAQQNLPTGEIQHTKMHKQKHSLLITIFNYEEGNTIHREKRQNHPSIALNI